MMAPGSGKMLANSLTALLAAVIAALFVRLAGAGASWLPPAGLLLAVALAMLALKTAVERGGAVLTSAGREPRAFLERHAFAVGLAGLALLALAVRLQGIATDLGHQPIGIDERRVAANIKRFFVQGEIGHSTVEHYPGIFYWMLVGSSLLAYLYDLMTGACASAHTMRLESFVLAGRLANVAVATATAVVTGLIGRQMSGRAAGMVAAGIMAVAPLPVETLLRNDNAQVLLVCAAVLAALAALESDRRRWPLLAGAFAGLATAVKYTSVFALVPALMASLMRGTPRARAGRTALACLGFAATVAATNHFLWYDFPNFIRQLSDQVAITGPEHWAATANPAAFHTSVLVHSGVGFTLLVMAAAFGVHGLATGRRGAWVFWAFPLLYSWFTTKRPSQFSRWVLPLLPFVAVAGAGALAWIVSTMRARQSGARRPATRVLRAASMAALAVAALGQPLWNALWAAAGRLADPTYRLVEQWLRERPAGTRILVPEGWLNLEGAPLQVRRLPDLAAVLGGDLQTLADVDFVVVPEPFIDDPGLRRLRLEKRVRAAPLSFGGTLGYDFDVYATPSARVAAEGEHTAIAPP